MLQETSKIWMDGKFVDWKDATVHVLTHTLHYGLGVFEGIRCYKTVDGPAVFRLAEHVDRLFASAHISGMKIPFTQEEFSAAIVETLKVNKMEAGYIRPLVYVGYGAMGVYPGRNPIRAMIAVWPWGAYLGDDGLEKGIRIKTASFTRQHVNISMTKAKVCGNYTNSIMGKVEAINDGYDEALFLDATGHVAEGSGENIFMVRRGVLTTTAALGDPRGDHPGRRAHDRGRPGDRGARGVSSPATSSTPPTRPSSPAPPPRSPRSAKWTGGPSAPGRAGRSPRTIQEAFFSAVRGENSKYRSWLTPVR